MINSRAQRQAHFAHDLRPHVQRRIGILPGLQRQLRPIFLRRARNRCTHLTVPPLASSPSSLVRRVVAKAHQHHHGLPIGNRRGVLAHPDHAVPLARKTIDLVLMLLFGVAANENIRRRILIVNFAGGGHRSPLLEDYTATFTRSTTTPPASCTLPRRAPPSLP